MQNDKLATIFSIPVRVYWEDTDAGGIVFYANYLKFFERARTEWLRSLGLQQQALKAELGGMFVVTGAQLRYLQPARLDDWLCVTARLHHVGRARCEVHQQAWLLPHGPVPTEPNGGTSPVLPASALAGEHGARLLCEAQVQTAWVDDQHLRPQRLPPPVWQAMQTVL